MKANKIPKTEIRYRLVEVSEGAFLAQFEHQGQTHYMDLMNLSVFERTFNLRFVKDKTEGEKVRPKGTCPECHAQAAKGRQIKHLMTCTQRLVK